MTIYLNKVEVISDVTPLRTGLTVEFTKPLCILVGDNGVGKSTLLECIADYYGYKDSTYLKRINMKNHIKVSSTSEFNFTCVDFHAEDSRFSANLRYTDLSLQLLHMKASSGQVSVSLLNTKLLKVKDSLVVLDEPCRGLSIRNKLKLFSVVENLLASNCQIILTTHSDILLKGFKELAQYFDIGLGQPTTYKDYMRSQLSYG